MCQSVGRFVCPEGVLWQNGWLDLNALWVESGVSRGWVYYMESTCLKKNGLGVFRHIGLNGVFEYFCILLVCEKSGPDLEGPGGPGPRPPIIEGPPTKLLLFYFLLMNQLMISL